MRHRRIMGAVAFTTVGYVILLAVWLNLFLPVSAEGTEGFQVVFLVCLYGCALGLSMMLAGRRSSVDRRIERDGLEGWATIRAATPLGTTVGHAQVTELDLELTVPGSGSYSGRVVYEVERRDLPRFAPGEVVTVFVDPDDRHRIMIYP